MVGRGSNNNYQYHMCLKEIGIHMLPNMINILGSIINIFDLI